LSKGASITFQELGAQLSELDEARKTAEKELENLEGREMLERQERDRDALWKSYVGVVPEALSELSGEERNRIYFMLCLEVYVLPNKDLEIRGALGEVILYSDGNVTTW